MSRDTTKTQQPGAKGQKGFSRRSLLKGVGVAVPTGLLVKQAPLAAAASPDAPVAGPGKVPITLRINAWIARFLRFMLPIPAVSLQDPS